MDNLYVSGVPCAMPTVGYGYGDFNRRDDNCNAYEAANNILNAVHNGTAANLQATGDAKGTIIDTVGNSTLHTTNALGVAVANINDQVSQHGLRNSDAIHLTQNAVHNVESRLTHGQGAIGHKIGDAESRLTRGQREIGQQIGDAKHDLSKEIGDSKFFMSQIGSDIRRELAKESCDTREKILENRFENQKSESRTRELLLEQNQKLQAQIAECCCETKTLFQKLEYQGQIASQAQANQIKELQLKLENDRLRDQLDSRDRHGRDRDLELTIRNIVQNGVGNTALRAA